MHGLQDACGAALHRQVQVGHDSGRLCHCGDDVRRKVLGIGGREADAADAGLPHLPQKLREARPAVEVPAVRVHVLAEEGDLAHAVVHQAGALLHYALHHAALLAAPHVGDYAVGAEVVAARHDGHPGVEGLRPVRGKVRGESAVALRDVHLQRTRRVVEGIGDELGHRGQGAGPEDDVHVGDALAKLLAVTLCDAAANRHHAPAAGRLRRAYHGRRHAVQVGVRVLAHAARHVDDYVRLFGRGDLDATAVIQDACDPLGVVQVHLAAKGLDVVRLAGKVGELPHSLPLRPIRGSG